MKQLRWRDGEVVEVHLMKTETELGEAFWVQANLWPHWTVLAKGQTGCAYALRHVPPHLQRRQMCVCVCVYFFNYKQSMQQKEAKSCPLLIFTSQLSMV